MWFFMAVYAWDAAALIMQGPPRSSDGLPGWVVWVVLALITGLLGPFLRVWRLGRIVVLFVQLQVVRRAIRRCRGRK